MNSRQQKQYNKLAEFAKEYGCELISKEYRTARTKMEFRCINGHIRVTNAGKFKGNPKGCKVCTAKCPEESEKSFHLKIKTLGGVVVGNYKNTHTSIECICRNNHICYPKPNLINQNYGMCIKCVNHCTIEAEKNFIENIERVGGRVIGSYIDGKVKVECICKNGHICYPRPTCTQQNRGICPTCTLERHKKNFYLRIEKLGGVVIGEYKNAHNKVECLCKNSHVCYPIPNCIQQNRGMCKTCTLEQTESNGEKFTTLALDKLGIQYTKQYKHPNLPKLIFDFQFDYEGKMVLIEFDGMQHQKYNKYFHRTPGSFERQRQRDLMKNYLVSNIPGILLIRLDHDWVTMVEPVEAIAEYIYEQIDDPPGTIVVGHLLYRWVYDDPEKESINKYFLAI